MIRADGLVKHFRAADGTLIKAVDGVSLTVHPGEMVGLLGANGVGKTTTMRMLATLLSPTAGTASVGGSDVRTDPLGVRRRLGYLSATTGVPDRLTPGEVLASFGRLHGLEETAIADRVASLVAALGLASCEHRPCGRLSTGQRQRVSLGRALVHDPPALVLDEPTSGLDAVGARDLLDLLERMRSEGRAVLVSTHRLHEIERRCDRFLIIHSGRILDERSRDELAGLTGGLEAAFFATLARGDDA
ncbi:MAG: ABC transporter ATP-binding protein [Planctomycetes bacterium]|nr:ABC transporter ATP-binding protein [Planctomycetota bacterium]